MNKKQIDLRIESKLIGKMANHRLMARDLFRKRHKGAFPELNVNQCMYHLNELRVWKRIAMRLDNTNSIPYETHYAKQLTK